MTTEELQQKIALRVQQASADPVVFIDRFCYTFNPKQEPYHLPFRLFEFQKNLVREVCKAIDEGYDLFIDKCREMGATYTILDVFLWYWKNVPGSNFLLGSRKQQYVDNRGATSNSTKGETSNKEESLFGKLDYTTSHLPPFMLPNGFDVRRHFTTMSLRNPEIGNVISGESSNPNFSRGGRHKAILLDEFAFWDNDASAWGATADTTRCRIVLTTPGIRPSKAKRLRFGKDGERIKVISLPYTLDPRKDAAWLDHERSRRSETDFAREIMIDWDVSVKGKVYEEIKHAVVGDFPFDARWPLFVSWDFGLDGTAIQWWQHNMVNGKFRLIDSYFNENKPIQFFLPLFGNPIDSAFEYRKEDIEAIELLKGFPKAVHYGDPDVAKRSYQDKETVSTREVLRSSGIYVQTKPETNTFYIRREKTKVFLQKGIEVNRTPRNDFWLEALQNARYPERNENSQATTAVNEPIHDWTSHHRTSTEYFAVNYQAPISPAVLVSQFHDESRELFDKNGLY